MGACPADAGAPPDEEPSVATAAAVAGRAAPPSASCTLTVIVSAAAEAAEASRTVAPARAKRRERIARRYACSLGVRHRTNGQGECPDSGQPPATASRPARSAAARTAAHTASWLDA